MVFKMCSEVSWGYSKVSIRLLNKKFNTGGQVSLNDSWTNRLNSLSDVSAECALGPALSPCRVVIRPNKSDQHHVWTECMPQDTPRILCSMSSPTADIQWSLICWIYTENILQKLKTMRLLGGKEPYHFISGAIDWPSFIQGSSYCLHYKRKDMMD